MTGVQKVRDGANTFDRKCGKRISPTHRGGVNASGDRDESYSVGTTKPTTAASSCSRVTILASSSFASVVWETLSRQRPAFGPSAIEARFTSRKRVMAAAPAAG